MSLLILIFSVIVVAQSTSSQAIQLPEKITILEIFQNAPIIKNCKSALIDPENAAFINKCNVTVPEKYLTEDNYKSFLCMSYYDSNLKICERLINDEINFQKQLPQNKSDIDNILLTYDGIDLAEDFCKKSHLDIGQTIFNQTKDYVQIFANALSDPEMCHHMCINWEKKLNPFCKIILWATNKLSDHQNSTNGYDKLNQLKTEHLKKTSVISKEIVSTVPPKVETVPVSSVEITPIKTEVVSSPVKEQTAPIPASVTDHRDVPLVEKEETVHQSVTSNVSPPLSAQVDNNSNKAVIGEIQKHKEDVQSLPTAQAVLPPVPRVVEQSPAPAKPKEDVLENIPLEGNKKSESSLDSQGADEQMEDSDTHIGGDSAIVSKIGDMENAYDDDQEQQEMPVKVNYATGEAGGAAPVENPTIVGDGAGYTASGKFIGAEDSHFFLYFLFASGVLILGYIIFHNKNKVLGLLLEGRKGEGRRRCAGGGPAYRKLDCTLEEAVSSAPPSHTPHIVY